MNSARAIRLPLILLAIVFSAGAAFAAESDEKPVRLAWFPRFSPDSKQLLTAHGGWDASEGGEVRVWNVDTGQLKSATSTARGVRTVAWSPTGEFFVAGDYGGVVRFYGTETGKQTDQMKLPDTAEVVLVSPDAARLYTAHGAGTIRVWELPDRKELKAWKQIHRGGIWGMALSPDGKMLAIAGKDGFVRVFDVADFKVLHELRHPQDTNGIAFSMDGKSLLTGCGDSAIRVFDATNGKELRRLEGHAGGSVTDLQFSADGKLLASCGMDRTVRLWDVSDFGAPTLKATLEGHAGLVFGVAISPDGRSLASAGWDDRVRVWDLSTLKERWSWSRSRSFWRF